MQPYIYKLTLLKDTESFGSGAVYVGQHNGTYKGYTTSGTIPTRLIKKYGKSIFKKEIIVQGGFNQCLLDDLERHYIRLSAANKTGLNLAIGGIPTGTPSRPVYQYDLKGSFIGKFDSITEASRQTETSRDIIKYALREKTPGMRGGKYLWTYVFTESLEPHYVKPGGYEVHQYTLGGYYIQSFDNSKKAGKALGIGSTTIWLASKQDNSKNTTAGGFLWSREKTDILTNYKIARAPNAKAVDMIDKSGKVIKTVSSARKASRELNKDNDYILRAIRSGKECSGYFWKWSPEVEVDNNTSYKLIE